MTLRRSLLAFLTAASTAAMTVPSQAAPTPTAAVQIRDLGNSGDRPVSSPALEVATARISPALPHTSVGVCSFLLSGPSTDPSSTPFHIEGHAGTATTRLVAAVELNCALMASGAVVGTLARTLPGYASVVAGSIPVSTVGPFHLCTMVNVYFENGDESNPNEEYACQPI